jgi:hypothetical protein
MWRCNALIILSCLAATVSFAAEPGSPPVRKPRPAPGQAEAHQPEAIATEATGATAAESEERPAETTLPQGRRRPEPPAGKIIRYAEHLIRQHDTNGNGVLDEQEWRGVGGNPLEADLNQDGTITPEELIQRIVVYGRHRSLRLVRPSSAIAAGAAPAEMAPVGEEAPSQPRAEVDPMSEPGASAEDDSSSNGAAAAEDGSLLAGRERESSNGADQRRLERQREQDRRSRKFFIPRERLPAGIASWFIDRDADGDGQITMREFSGKWSSEVAAEFSSYDRNRDGVITAAESVRGGAKKSATEAAQAPPAEEPARSAAK